MQKLLGVARMIFAREPLPPSPGEPPVRLARPGLVALLFRAEPLPLDPPAPPRTRHLRLLLGAERLPLDPPGPPRPRARWLRWLLLPEDPDQP